MRALALAFAVALTVAAAPTTHIRVNATGCQAVTVHSAAGYTVTMHHADQWGSWTDAAQLVVTRNHQRFTGIRPAGRWTYWVRKGDSITQWSQPIVATGEVTVRPCR